MIKVKFNKIDYNVPESWSEVLLEQVIKCQEISDLIPESPVVAIINAYTSIPILELKQSRIQKINEILDILVFLYTPYTPKLMNSFILNNIEYRAEPDISEMCFQDYISIQTILYNYRDNIVRALPRMLAVLAKKPDETLDDIDLDQRSSEFLKLPYSQAKDLEFFFTSAITSLEVVSRLSLTQKEQREVIMQQFLELNNTMKKRKERVGTSWLTKFQIGFWQIYLKYIKRDLEKSFNSSLTEYSKMNFIKTVKNSYTKLVGNKSL